MPNIEMHGFLRSGDDTNLGEDIKKSGQYVTEIHDQIIAAISDAAYVREVVITEMLSSCEDTEKKEAPFLRVWATTQEHLDDLVGRLMQIDIDIEVAPLLSQFIDRKSVREAAQEVLKTVRPTCGTDREFDYHVPIMPTGHPDEM